MNRRHRPAAGAQRRSAPASTRLIAFQVQREPFMWLTRQLGGPAASTQHYPPACRPRAATASFQPQHTS